MERPRRQRQPPKAFEATQSVKTRWTLKEKKSLLEAVKRHGKDDIPALAKSVGTKAKAEVREYLLGLMDRRLPTEKRKEQAPIETWLELASDLTKQDADYSDNIAHVMSVCGNLEPHVPCRSKSEVNYSAIYLHLAALLRGDPTPPQLNGPSAAVLLDLLQGLVDTLENSDMNLQRHLMTEKYSLLRSRVCPDSKSHHQAARKALENDIDMESVVLPSKKALYPHNVTPEMTTQQSRGLPTNECPAAPTSSQGLPVHPEEATAGTSTPHSQAVARDGEASTSKPVTSVVSAATAAPTAASHQQVIRLPKGALPTFYLPGPNGEKIMITAPQLNLSQTPGAPQTLRLVLPAGVKLSAGSYQLKSQSLPCSSPAQQSPHPQPRQPQLQQDKEPHSQAPQAQQQQDTQSQSSKRQSQKVKEPDRQQQHPRPQLTGQSQAHHGKEQEALPQQEGQRQAQQNKELPVQLQQPQTETAPHSAEMSAAERSIALLDKVTESQCLLQTRKRPVASSQEPILKRTPLYSLNPFCIPIKYLKVKRIKREDEPE